MDPPTSSPVVELPLVSNLVDQLCDTCRDIPWSDLADKKFPHEIRLERVRPITESHASLLTAPCPVCRVLSLIKPPSLDNETCWLVAMSSTVIRYGSSIYTKEWNDCTYLGIEVKWPRHDSGRILTDSKMYIALLKDNHSDYVGTTRISPKKVNFNFIKEAIATCQQKHENCQGVTSSNVSSLYVIDCRNGNVIPAPEGCQYLALSYVWGDLGEKGFKSSSIAYPPVIQDSINVTLDLGYQYLWVDRVCILEGAQHKTQMINAMDQIYSHAFATIVAAAGEDADYGLPGMGLRDRTPQAQISIGDTTLLEHISAEPSVVLKSSKWGSRGWTFQEGLLSQRRIIFTDRQVYFVCRDAFIMESVKRPYEYTGCLDQQAFEAAEMIVPSYRQVLNNRTKETLMYMKAHISEYTKRDLRFEEDSLRAILGVLIFYSRKRVFHIWGAPVVYWGYSIEGIAIQLDWYHPQPARRRTNFPSWSYTGWSGAVEWTSDAYNYDTERCPCDISFVTADGGLTRIADIKRRHLSGKDGEYAISKSLLISSRVFPITFKHVHQDQAPKRWAQRWQAPHYPLPVTGLFAVFPWTEDLSICAVPLLDTDRPLESGMTGLILHMINREMKHMKGAHSSTFMVLILQPIGRDRYERIGIMMLDIDEAPAYLDGQGSALDSQPNMIKTPSWSGSIWFKQSQEMTIELI